MAYPFKSIFNSKRRKGREPYLCRRLASHADALDHQFPVLGGDKEVALKDLGLLGRDQDAQLGESRAQRWLAVVRGRGLTLVRAVVFQLHWVYVQREVTWNREKPSVLFTRSVLRDRSCISFSVALIRAKESDRSSDLHSFRLQGDLKGYETSLCLACSDPSVRDFCDIADSRVIPLPSRLFIFDRGPRTMERSILWNCNEACASPALSLRLGVKIASREAAMNF